MGPWLQPPSFPRQDQNEFEGTIHMAHGSPGMFQELSTPKLHGWSSFRIFSTLCIFTKKKCISTRQDPGMGQGETTDSGRSPKKIGLLNDLTIGPYPFYVFRTSISPVSQWSHASQKSCRPRDFLLTIKVFHCYGESLLLDFLQYEFALSSSAGSTNSVPSQAVSTGAV